jgi:hypothetical protein
MMYWQEQAQQRQQAALKFSDRVEALSTFHANQDRLYVWLRKQRSKGWRFEQAWKQAGGLCCRATKAIQATNAQPCGWFGA